MASKKFDSHLNLYSRRVSYAPRGLPVGPLLSRPEKNDISLSLSILVESCAAGSGVAGSCARFASRSCRWISLVEDGKNVIDKPATVSPFRQH